MQRVTGIGGVFFKSDNPEGLYEWYAKHLGIQKSAEGYIAFRWRELDRPDERGSTAWSIFPQQSTYFEPTAAPFMVNYRVANLDALLEELRKESVWIDDKRDNSFGKFAWIRDCDGNRIELWEPPTTT